MLYYHLFFVDLSYYVSIGEEEEVDFSLFPCVDCVYVRALARAQALSLSISFHGIKVWCG